MLDAFIFVFVIAIVGMVVMIVSESKFFNG